MVAPCTYPKAESCPPRDRCLFSKFDSVLNVVQIEAILAEFTSIARTKSAADTNCCRDNVGQIASAEDNAICFWKCPEVLTVVSIASFCGAAGNQLAAGL